MDKKILAIVGVVVVIGAVIGLGMAGILPIPGLSPHKAKKAAKEAQKDSKKDAAPVDAKKATELAAKQKAAADEAAKKALAEKVAADQLIADQKGYKKLAGIWGEMKPEDIATLLLAHYKPEDAAPILKLMDEEQVAAIFTSLAASRTESGTPGVKNPDVGAYGDALAKEVSKPDPALLAKN